MAFTDLFIRRPVLSIVVSLLIFLLGLRALLELPIRQFPLVETTAITIVTTYPGASPELMQGFITTPIEQAIASTEGLDYVIASSTQNRSQIVAYMRLDYDPNKALTEILSKVQAVKNQIPREANDPVITKARIDYTSVLFLAFDSKTMTRPQIADYLTRVVQPVLSTIDGVASIDIAGGATFAMRLWLDPQRMAARGITGADVQNAIVANNSQSAPGQVKGFYTTANIAIDTGLKDADEFRDMVVKADGGAIVRMRDIATVDLDARDMNQTSLIDGRPGLVIQVNATPDGNPLTIADGILKKLQALRHDMPPALEIKIAFDSTSFVRDSIREVVLGLIEAVVIIVLVVFLSLGTFRSVLIPIVTIPLSVVGAASLMAAAGFSLNLLTLLAMVLAIGLVVDDAIVVVENVHRHIRDGLTPIKAALVGAREIAGPVIAMTITLAAVYAPIGLMSGLTGALFREFAFTLAGAVIISGVVALVLSPMMASFMLTADMSEGRFARWVDRIYERFTVWYGRRLGWAIHHRAATLVFAAVVLGSLYFLYAGAKTELAPLEDYSFFNGGIKSPQYANIDYTTAFARQADQLLTTIPEVNGRIFLNIQANGVYFWANLTPPDQRSRTQFDVMDDFQNRAAQVTGATVTAYPQSALPDSSGGAPVQMVITSVGGYEAIFHVMEDLKAAANDSGLFAFVDSDLDYNTPEIHLRIDHAKANALGITNQAIGATLEALVGENYVNRFNLDGRSYEVIPQVPRDLRLDAAALGQYDVATATGQQIPLSTVVSAERGTGPNAFVEYNQLNSATLSAAPRAGVTMGQAVAFLEQASKTVLPQGFSHDYLSDSRQYVTEGNALLLTFGFALVAIYLVLAAQFESLVDPLVILVAVPMSICGALIPLYFGGAMGVHGATINIYSQIGMVTLIGLISKHGILMVAFANDLQRGEQLDRSTAIQRAARIRLRPILMTTAAMVLGVAPLLFATGAGANSRFSIGLVIASGMTIGTLFTLFVLPAVYTVLAQDHRHEARSARNLEMAEAG
jgi:multidrug efflux pump